MKWAILVFLLSSIMFASEDLKKIIVEKSRRLDMVLPQQKSKLYLELAVAYYKDQEIDRAFSHFLEALKLQAKAVAPGMEPGEPELYSKALEDYLLLSGTDPVAAAAELLRKYGENANQFPHFLHLNFLIATAYANLGNFEEFFERFYRGYPYLHDSFLAYKIQGVLILRLAHHGKTDEERRRYQEEAFRYLSLALDKNEKDPGLYKVLYFLAKEEKKKKLTRDYLEKIVENQVVLPRADIFFYVREAVALGAFETGQGIIDQAKKHYEFSRAIAAAQDYLNQQR
jgi:tetratricopeptide (TPR) repeat protein